MNLRSKVAKLSFLFSCFFVLSAVLCVNLYAAENAHDAEHAQVAHESAHGEEHGGAHGGGHGEGVTLHLPTWFSVLNEAVPDNPAVKFLLENENLIFSIFVAGLISLAAWSAYKRSEMIPRGIQNVFEFAVESLDNFVCGILGDRGRQFTPFIGTIFLYIFFLNALGIIPLFKSATSSFGITFPLGLAVFFYVQYTGIRQLGLMKYFDHLAGEPRNAVGFMLIPLMLFLHVVGEFVKPLSLSLRLFGNIWGEDVLIAVFVGMGSKMFVPLHFPFLFLALLTSFVQATVFCLLTTIYIALMLPHEHEHDHEHGHAEKPAHAEAIH